MPEKSNSKKKFNPIIWFLLLLVIALAAYLVLQSGILGGGTSCESLLKEYKNAAAVEDYPKVSEYFKKLSEKGCKF
jgi:hypothetical protein